LDRRERAEARRVVPQRGQTVGIGERAVHGDEERRRRQRQRREIAREPIGDATRLFARRQRAHVGARRTQAQEGRGQEQERGGDGDGDGDAAPDHASREAPPPRRRRRDRATPQGADASALDARAERQQERRQDDERQRGGEHDDGDAADGDRAEERLREDEQAAQRGADGQAGEEDRAAGGGHGAGAGALALDGRGREQAARGGELLAVAAQDEERIVDGDAEAEDGD